MAYVTRAEIEKAKEMDLLTYLQTFEPYELVRVGGNTYCTREHDSLKISNGKWNWFSRGIGGRSALDYLVKVRGYPFPLAVNTILGKADIPPRAVPAEKEKPKVLKLPELSDTTGNVKKYLTGRGIDPEIIDWCIEHRLIFETKKYANAVFAGYDKYGNMKYAALRGTRSMFKGDASGSNKSFSFFIPGSADSKSVHLFEAAIDLLSYATLRKMNGLDWQEESLLSLAGVAHGENTREELPKPLARYLREHPGTENVYLHLDNDDAGRSAAISIARKLHSKCHAEIVPIEDGKDVNDELMAKLSGKERDLER